MKSPPSIHFFNVLVRMTTANLGINERASDSLRGINPLEFFQNSNEKSSTVPIQHDTIWKIWEHARKCLWVGLFIMFDGLFKIFLHRSTVDGTAEKSTLKMTWCCHHLTALRFSFPLLTRAFSIVLSLLERNLFVCLAVISDKVSTPHVGCPLAFSWYDMSSSSRWI